MRFTREQYDLYEMRRAAKHAPVKDYEAAAPGTEDALHGEIISHLKPNGYVYFHSATHRKTHRTLGEPDFIVFLPNSRTLLVECKTRTGKNSDEQRDVHYALKRLGHTVHIVRSLKHFIQLCEVP